MYHRPLRERVLDSQISSNALGQPLSRDLALTLLGATADKIGNDAVKKKECRVRAWQMGKHRDPANHRPLVEYVEKKAGLSHVPARGRLICQRRGAEFRHTEFPVPRQFLPKEKIRHGGL
jgi:hypothetical protein